MIKNILFYFKTLFVNVLLDGSSYTIILSLTKHFTLNPGKSTAILKMTFFIFDYRDDLFSSLLS
jgi:hypothetical protein